ncbi:hypothetical protein A6R70_14570 [Agrobacterium rubi]|nr:hypothetical protein [Agrobacterium rubi]
MMNTSLQNPNRHIPDRSTIDAMTAEWIAKNGEPRKFERGFSSEWDAMQRLMASFGFELLYRGQRYYTLLPVGWTGSTRRFDRQQLLDRVDEILIENGRQPFRLRGKP